MHTISTSPVSGPWYRCHSATPSPPPPAPPPAPLLLLLLLFLLRLPEDHEQDGLPALLLLQGLHLPQLQGGGQQGEVAGGAGAGYRAGECSADRRVQKSTVNVEYVRVQKSTVENIRASPFQQHLSGHLRREKCPLPRPPCRVTMFRTEQVS